MKKKCPKCGCELKKIIYGMPTLETFEASERGEVVLGGCCIIDGGPDYRCDECRLEYSKDLKETFEIEDFDEDE
ncbi:MAG: hypothetical protein MJ154_00750 [Candidatus Saccharibacteria bacterium]|nr:hypothetical protein [Candidatus Saccharibacteria bacterium]